MGKYTGFNVFLRHALKYGFSLWGITKTGQTIKYADGDDGDYQKGYPRQGPRFTDNGDGTITDNTTGLMWIKDWGGAGGFGGADKSWANALTDIEALTFAGYSDWRLPNVKELLSVVNYAQYAPPIDTAIFQNIRSGFYWSSTTSSIDAARAFGVGYGGYGHSNAILKSTTRYYVAVRGGF